MHCDGTATSGSAVDLYWIPLGAGSPVVQASGRLFERVSAWQHRRPRNDLYHAALRVSTPRGRYAIEQAPVPDGHGDARGVVAVGPVGLRVAGRLRIFRYEVRCWRNGRIPDLAFAIDSPVRLTTDEVVAARVVDELAAVPTLVWGRDEAGVGEMWNSNSVIAWVLTRSGIDIDQLCPPPNGRAPGWHAGRVVAGNPLAGPYRDGRRGSWRSTWRWVSTRWTSGSGRMDGGEARPSRAARAHGGQRRAPDDGLGRRRHPAGVARRG